MCYHEFWRMGKPRSGEIFGILKQMKETFETNLSASQKEELQNQVFLLGLGLEGW